MNLHLLRTGPHLSIFYDSWNDWLFADWEGELTLPAVQAGCVELAYICLSRVYPRVLNSNMLVTGVSWDVAPWLGQKFLPALGMAGVKQLAWVCAPTLRGHDVVQNIISQQPTLGLVLFEDMDLAVSWLQRRHTAQVIGCTPQLRPLDEQARLARVVHDFARKPTTRLPAS